MKKDEVSLTVAVVDDDEAVLDAVKTVLENQHWNTQTYSSGEAFLADMKQHKPDCLIIDLKLPGVNGAEVVQTIASTREILPVIVLTAYPESPMAIEMLTMGVSEVLVKPVTAGVLIKHIQTSMSHVV